MTGLFNLAWNHELPLTRIESIRSRGHGSDTGTTHRMKLTDDDNWHELGRHAYHELITRPMQLLPANPPVELACWVLDDQPEIWFEPVIAWALCVDGEVRPVTAGGVCNGTYSDVDDDYVRFPDGRIKAVGRHTYIVGFDNAEAFLAHLIQCKQDDKRWVSSTGNEDAAA